MEYERKGEWSGMTIHEARTGWVVEWESRIQGDKSDGLRVLIPYESKPGGYERGADLAAPHSEMCTIGEWIAEWAEGERHGLEGLAITLRNGVKVQ